MAMSIGQPNFFSSGDKKPRLAGLGVYFFLRGRIGISSPLPSGGALGASSITVSTWPSSATTPSFRRVGLIFFIASHAAFSSSLFVSGTAEFPL
jgi:hypothetical protein